MESRVQLCLYTRRLRKMFKSIWRGLVTYTTGVLLFLMFTQVSDKKVMPTVVSDLDAKELDVKLIPHLDFDATLLDSTFKTIHVHVALCDNKYQGIVPVPAKIGNGQDPDNNLYWGCGFGIRTYFKKSKDWKLLKLYQPDTIRLERLVFKHANQPFLLVADAYDGKEIETCTYDFLHAAAGYTPDTFHLDNKIYGLGSSAEVLAYIGHNGLMDFDLDANISFTNQDGNKRSTIILACVSKFYFADYMDKNYINPLLWTTGLMAPEAYTLHDALGAYVLGKSNTEIRSKGAEAYHKFQKCGLNAAKKLLVTGWE